MFKSTIPSRFNFIKYKRADRQRERETLKQTEVIAIPALTATTVLLTLRHAKSDLLYCHTRVQRKFQHKEPFYKILFVIRRLMKNYDEVYNGDGEKSHVLDVDTTKFWHKIFEIQDTRVIGLYSQ